jgi:hypothetical protein
MKRFIFPFIKRETNKRIIVTLFSTVVSSLIFPSEVWSAVSIAPVSTEGLFLCNAGLIHPRTETLCRSARTATVCDPNTTDSIDCVCASGSSIGDLVSGTIIQGPKTTFKEVPAGETAYAYLVDPAVAFDSEIANVEFNLGSEQYGTKYFLQFCYQGPLEDIQAPFPGGPRVDISLGIYKMKLSMTSADRMYNAKLESNAQVSYQCDLRSLGLNTAPRKNGVTPGDFPLEVDAFNQGPLPIADATPGSSRELVLNLNSIETQVPRYCVLTVSFSELPKDIRSLKSKADFSGTLDIVR